MKKRRRKRFNFVRFRKLINRKSRSFNIVSNKIKVSANALFSLYFNSLNSNFSNLDKLITDSKNTKNYINSPTLNLEQSIKLRQTRFTFKTKLFKTPKIVRRRVRKSYLRSKKFLDTINKLYSRNLPIKNNIPPKKLFKRTKKPFITLFSKYRVIFKPLLFSYKRSFSKKRFYFFRRKY
jgi:hypothetical protein